MTDEMLDPLKSERANRRFSLPLRPARRDWVRRLMTRRFPQFALLAVLLLSGCAGLSSGTGLECFTGYWSVGAAFSNFTDADGKLIFRIYDNDMPPAARSFLDAQPEHYDSISESGSAQSAYFEVLGRPYTDQDGNYRLHVEKVLRMGPADPKYLARYVTRRKA